MGVRARAQSQTCAKGLLMPASEECHEAVRVEHLLPGAAVATVDGEDEGGEGACVSGLARTLRQRLEEERRRTEEAEAELDRQRAANAGLGASLSRSEAQLAASKAFWEVSERTRSVVLAPRTRLNRRWRCTCRAPCYAGLLCMPSKPVRSGLWQ